MWVASLIAHHLLVHFCTYFFRIVNLANNILGFAVETSFPVIMAESYGIFLYPKVAWFSSYLRRFFVESVLGPDGCL